MLGHTSSSALMACPQLQDFMSVIGNKCRQTLRLKKPTKRIEISAPFDFKEVPIANFPGYSVDDLSLMKEKAIASTAVFDDHGNFDINFTRQKFRSRTSSYGCGIEGKVVHYARRLSRTYYPS